MALTTEVRTFQVMETFYILTVAAGAQLYVFIKTQNCTWGKGDFTRWKLHLNYTNKPSFSALLFPGGSQPDSEQKPEAGRARIVVSP